MELSIKKHSIIGYNEMIKILKDKGILQYDKIIQDPDYEDEDEDEILKDPRDVFMFENDGKTYVMKLGNYARRDDTNKFNLLKNEAKIYNELNNFSETDKYFPKIINSGEIKEPGILFYYITIEYIKGKTLYEYLNEKSKIINFNNSNEILTILLNLTNALNALWSHGIVHGDLSVENIIIEDDLNVKLIDFEKSSKSKHLQENTVSNSMLNETSKETTGTGYFYLVRISLSVLKNTELYLRLLNGIKSLIIECQYCTDIYYNCAELIKTELKLTGGSKTRKTRKAIRSKSKKATRNSKKGIKHKIEGKFRPRD